MSDVNLLPDLTPAKGQGQASGRNPYFDMILSTPELTAPTNAGDERSLSDRFRLNMEAGRRETVLGAGEAVLFDPAKDDVDLDNPGDVADHLRGVRIRELEEEWNAMRPARTPIEIAAGLGGFLTGAASSPEAFVALPTKFVTGGVSALQRILRAGTAGAAINTAIDPVVQSLRIEAGLQEEYSPTQTFFSALLGAAIPGVAQTGVEAFRPRGSAAEVPTPQRLRPSPAREEPGSGRILTDDERTSLEQELEGRELDIADAEAGQAVEPPEIAEDLGPALPPEEARSAIDSVADEDVVQPAARDADEPDLAKEAVTAAREIEPETVPDFTPEAAVGAAPTPNQRAGTFQFDTRALQVDAEAFQFKSGGDAEGVTPILRGVTKWDPDAAGQFVVWQRNDGQLFVADGHQRIGLANRLIANGNEAEIKVPGSLYRESDGFSPNDVMVIAALKNIKEGSGDITDAARVLRTEPDRIAEIEEIGRAQTRQAVALAQVSDEVWRMALNDVIEPRHAAIIGRIIADDPVLQEAAAKAVARAAPANDSEAEVLVRRVRESELVRAEDESQGSLLVDLDSPESLVAEEVRIVSRAIKTLSRDKNIMRRVAANAESIERVGSRIERDATTSAADESAALARIVESVAFSRGEVRDSLIELAKELKNGSRSIGDVVDAFIVALRRAEAVSAKRGGEARRGGSGESAEGEDAPSAGLFGSKAEEPEARATEPEVAAGEPVKIGTGDRLVSQSGRQLAPVPKIDLGSDRKTQNTLKRIDAWLVDEAVKEAEATGNDFVLTQMRALDPNNLSPSDRDAANLVLFGSPSGATADNFIREGDLAIKAPTEEEGAEGKPQLVIPGAERVSQDDLAKRRAAEPLKPRAVQERSAGPLFDDGAAQLDLVDMVRKAEGKPLAFSQRIRGRPLRGETNRPETGVPSGPESPQAERLRATSERLSNTLGLTVRQGRINQPGALGTFSPTSGVVRLKELDAFDILSHEGGHGLQFRPENKPAIDGLIAANASEIERLAYVGTSPGDERVEGFAEWFRLWITNPEYARREAPSFTEAFEGWIGQNRPQIDADLREVQAAYKDWLEAPSRDVLTGDLVSSGAPPITTKISRALGTDRAPSGENLMSFAGRFYTWTIDRLHPVNRAIRALLDIHQRNTGTKAELRPTSDPYKLLRLATSSHQSGHIDLVNGIVPYRELDPVGPSVAEALELAIGKNWYGNWRSDQMIDFGGYLVARRSIVEFERFKAGEVPNPPGKLTLGDYKQAIDEFEAAFPNFRPAAEMIYEWNRNLLQKKRDAGLVSDAYFTRSLAKPDYVPFRRDFSEKIEELIRPTGPGGNNRQNIMKAYRGSLRSIINPIETMMSEAYSVAAIIARNDAITALADLAERAGPGGGAIAEKIPARQIKPLKVDIFEALRAAGKDAGLDKDDLDDLLLAASERLDTEQLVTTLYRAGDAPEMGEPIVYYWRGGQRHALRLADRRFGKDLYEAVTSIGTEQSGWIIRTLAVPARALRMGITTSPEFLMANYFRDQIAAFVLNAKFVPFASGARGMADEIAQTRAARLYAQAGGIMGGANVASLDQARIGRSINALRKKGYQISRLKDPRELLKLTEISETGTRVALFRQYFNTARKQGLSEYESMIEAAFQARDFIDFGRHGSKMLFARRIVTFLNAALQGTDKTARTLVSDLRPLARTFRGETMTGAERQLVGRSAQAWLKIATLTALSATYALMNRDDPEWQQASEYLRATHWLFKVPGGKWVALPKPYELATFMNFGERMAEGMASEDPTWAEKWLRSWGYTLAIPVEPAALMVPAEVGFNFDTFRDRPIVQQWDQGLEPWQQYYQYTSEFSKAIGKAINVSPAKIDHMIVGWTGSWGRNLMAVSNALFDPQRRSDELYDWPVFGRFVKNLARGSDATDKFYGLISETSGRLERKNNAYKEMIRRGQESEADGFYGSLQDDEKVWVALNSLETADEKRVHPLRRASDILRIYSGMRKDISNRNVVGVITDRKIDVNATVAAAINDQLGRAATAEARNAMIVVGAPGWASRELMETNPHIDAIRTLAPAVADEIEDRLNKKKVLPFDGVRAVWPEVRDRLLREGPESNLSDLRAKAIAG